MEDSALSPRHARRRSMPASFSSFQHKGKAASSNAAGAVGKDKLSVACYWDEYENHVLAKRLLSSSLKQEELNWKAKVGLGGDAFWGFSSKYAEDAFFQCRLEARRRLVSPFLLILFLLLVREFISNLEDTVASKFAAVSLWTTGLFAFFFSHRYVKSEKTIAAFFVLTGMLVSFQNVAYSELFRFGRISDEVFTPNAPAAVVRKRVFVLLFYLLLGCSMIFGMRPSLMSVITLLYAFFSHLPSFYYFWWRISEYPQFEVFFTVVGPVYYMLIGMLLLGTLNNRSDRIDFEQRILKYDMECKVAQVRFSSQTNLSGSASDLGVQVGGSASSLSAGSMESMSNIAQESILDKRIRAFQQIQKDYAVRRHPTMLVLIDICIGALALAVKQIQGANSNWAEFFSAQQAEEKPLQVRASDGERKATSTSTISKRRRRHSVVTVELGDTAEDDVLKGASSGASNGIRKRCSSSDRLTDLFLLDKKDYPPFMETDVSLTADLDKHLRDWNFGPKRGIWSTLFSEATGKPLLARPLAQVTMRTMKLLGVFEYDELHLDERVCHEYLQMLEEAYLPPDRVPYHNALHACDVVQTLCAMLCIDTVELPPLALFALLLAAASHDVAHPGLNNNHLVQSQHDLALTYNDKSVLENFHAAKAFSIMSSSPATDVLAGLRRARKMDLCANFRSLVVEMILSTDLKYHFDQQAKLRVLVAEQCQQSAKSSKASLEDPYLDNSDRSLTDTSIRGLVFTSQADVSLVCSALLHTADISNVAKTWDSYKPWLDCLFEEFFRQGDLERERGLEVQPMMDRMQCNPANAQIYFITNLVTPLYQVLEPLLPRSCERAIFEMERNVEKLRDMASHHTLEAASVGRQKS